MLESCLVAFTDIVFHAETGKSNCEKRLRGVELLHQIDPSSIWQSQVANEHVKLLVRAEIERRFTIERRLHVIAAPPEQIRQRAVRIFVVLNEKNSQRLAFRQSG